MSTDPFGPPPTPEEELERYSALLHDEYEKVRQLREERDTYQMRRDYLAKELIEREKELSGVWSLVGALKKELGE